MPKYAVLQDARNGVSPVLVTIPNGPISEKSIVYATYPFGWEEYTGSPRLERFERPDKDVTAELVREILILREVLKSILSASDKTLSSKAYESGKVPTDVEEVYGRDNVIIVPGVNS